MAVSPLDPAKETVLAPQTPEVASPVAPQPHPTYSPAFQQADAFVAYHEGGKTVNDGIGHRSGYSDVGQGIGQTGGVCDIRKDGISSFTP